MVNKISLKNKNNIIELKKLLKEYKNKAGAANVNDNWNLSWEYNKKAEKAEIKILRIQLNYNKIRSLFRKTFPDIVARGRNDWGGHVDSPTPHDKEITIWWKGTEFASDTERNKNFKMIKDNFLPVLKTHNIEYIINNRDKRIIIK